MGLETNGITPAQSFNPSNSVDKAQFSTILSRLLYGEVNNNTETLERRANHAQALVDGGIVTVTTDLFDPLIRAHAMIMLMRSAE